MSNQNWKTEQNVGFTTRKSAVFGCRQHKRTAETLAIKEGIQHLAGFQGFDDVDTDSWVPLEAFPLFLDLWTVLHSNCSSNQCMGLHNSSGRALQR